jgi:hypothetical protein
MDRHVRDEDVVQAGLDTLVGSMYFAMPGTCVSYNDTTQRASIQPNLADVRRDIVTNLPVYEPWPVLQNVKVFWPQSGTMIMAGSMKPGDQVTLEAYDYDPTGITQPGTQIVNPVDVRKLGGNYWRARPDAMTVPLSAADAAAIKAGGLVGMPSASAQGAQIQFVPGSILLGVGAVNPVALANLVAAELQKIVAALGSAVAPSGGGPVTYGSPYTSPGSVAAQKVKGI